MPYVCIVRGEEREVLARGNRSVAVPFMGTDRGGEFAKLGLGLTFPNEMRTMFWGLVASHMVVRMWRSFVILDRLRALDSGTLKACWEATSPKSLLETESSLKQLAPQLGGIAHAREFREQVLSYAPLPADLDAILDELRIRRVPVDEEELEREMLVGCVSCTTSVRRVLEGVEHERRAARLQHLFTPAAEEPQQTFFSRLCSFFK